MRSRNEGANSLKLLVFDFDGVIADTEPCYIQSWQQIYESYHAEFPKDRYIKAIGCSDMPFDPYRDLLDRCIVGVRPRSRSSVVGLYKKYYSNLADRQPIMPGVQHLISSAKRDRVSLAVASGAPFSWVGHHLQRLGLMGAFDHIVCLDDVTQGKPHPAVYNRVLSIADIRADSAIAIEDSTNGIAAAKDAGVTCIAVQSSTTGVHDVSTADAVIPSLEGATVEHLLSLVGEDNGA